MKRSGWNLSGSDQYLSQRCKTYWLLSICDVCFVLEVVMQGIIPLKSIEYSM